MALLGAHTKGHERVDHARQQLRRRAAQPPGRAEARVAVLDRRKTKPRKYSYDAIKVLRRVWAISGGACGKYLAVAMYELLEAVDQPTALPGLRPGKSPQSP